MPGNKENVAAGTKQVVGYSCGGRYGVDRTVWNTRMANTKKGDNRPERTIVDRTEPASRILGRTGDTKGTAEGEIELFDDKTEEVELDKDDTTLDASQGKTCIDKST